MGVKGISWIEANFEKLIVVVMLVAFLAVLIFQFVLRSNAVEVEGNRVSLAKAFQAAERAAERLQARIADPDPELPAAVATLDLADEFERAISGGVVAADRFLALGDPLTIDVDISETRLAAGEYAPFVPPAPVAPKAASYRATLDPYAVSEFEGLAAYLPAEQPFDTPWVSVQSSFSGELLKEAYENDPDGPGGKIAALPGSWWERGAGVLAVEVERQERGIDGRWGPAAPVTRMPGVASVLDDLDETAANYKAAPGDRRAGRPRGALGAPAWVRGPARGRAVGAARGSPRFERGRAAAKPDPCARTPARGHRQEHCTQTGLIGGPRGLGRG